MLLKNEGAPIIQNIPVSSIQAITSSIQCDFQVYRWFDSLVTLPAVKNLLISKSAAKQPYIDLKKTTFFQNFLTGILLGVFIIFFLTHNPLILVLTAPVIYYCFKIHKRARALVSQISSLLFAQDFEDSKLRQNTLYQLMEFYGNTYRVPSFIDVISRLDDICRKVLLLLLLADFIIYAFIYQFPLWINVLFIMALYYSIYALLNSTFFYRHIK